VTEQRRRKKCHGKRKLQRFRKKCYKQGLTKEEIQKLIDEYHRNNEQGNVENMETTTDLNDTVEKSTRSTSSKRKRMTLSSSQRSTSHPLAKRIKRKQSSQISVTPIKPDYKLPLYLKMHPNLLFRTLRQQLKHPLKKKNERQFIHHRLQILDQQYRLSLHQNLWQSYLTLGSEKQVWPVSSKTSFDF